MFVSSLLYIRTMCAFIEFDSPKHLEVGVKVKTTFQEKKETPPSSSSARYNIFARTETESSKQNCPQAEEDKQDCPPRALVLNVHSRQVGPQISPRLAVGTTGHEVRAGLCFTAQNANGLQQTPLSRVKVTWSRHENTKVRNTASRFY